MAASIPLATFDDFSSKDPDILSLTVETGYKALAQVKLYVPTFTEWNELWWSVDDEPVPFSAPGPGGTKIANEFAVEYRKGQAARNDERRRRLLSFALTRAGMDLPGRTDQEKADSLDGWKASYFNLLWAALWEAVKGGRYWQDAEGLRFRALRRALASGDAQVQAFAERLADYDPYPEDADVDRNDAPSGLSGGPDESADE